MKNNVKQYLLWFANEHPDFRLSEIKSILSLLDLPVNLNASFCHSQPYLIIELQSDELARRIASRSVTLKHITKLWASGKKVQDLHRDLKLYSETHLLKKTHLHEVPFKVNVEVFCNSQTLEEKIKKIESFHYMPFKGPISLSNPGFTLQYLEFYGTDPNNVPAEPYEVFFGKLIAKSQRRSVMELSLKKRKFIGNTSMDAELSLIMANQAKVNAGDIVFDPFVGSGSLLVAAAYFGGYVFGTDIDFLMIHGKTKPTRIQNRDNAREDENVLANMRQYGFEKQYIDVVVGDSSLPIWRSNLVLDAIITDPPYGMRETSERIGAQVKSHRVGRVNKTPEAPSYPMKVGYTFQQIMKDLLCFSAIHLKMGGRLVTWIPVFRADYKENDYVPKHACFSVISNCEQVLSKMISRRLLTFEKIREPMSEELDSCDISDNNFREQYFNYKYGSKMSSGC